MLGADFKEEAIRFRAPQVGGKLAFQGRLCQTIIHDQLCLSQLVKAKGMIALIVRKMNGRAVQLGQVAAIAFLPFNGLGGFKLNLIACIARKIF